MLIRMLVVCALFSAMMHVGTGKAYANDVVDAAYTVGGWGRSVLVVTDNVLHWTWNTLHNKVVHPVVNVLTVGTVDLGADTNE